MAAPITRKMFSNSRSLFANLSALGCDLTKISTSCGKNYSMLTWSPIAVGNLQTRCFHGNLQTRCFHVSSRQNDLMEFFDEKKHWGAESIKTGRPWLRDELRLKSNAEIHKLWYVLLKERNVLMTMESEYTRQKELFPNPERMEKVEESMENILEVVDERNRAYNMLDTGKTGEPGKVEDVDVLGRPVERHVKEYYIPKFMNNTFINKYRLLGPWVYKYLRLWREKHFIASGKRKNKAHAYKAQLKERFPDADID